MKRDTAAILAIAGILHIFPTISASAQAPATAGAVIDTATNDRIKLDLSSLPLLQSQRITRSLAAKGEVVRVSNSEQYIVPRSSLLGSLSPNGGLARVDLDGAQINDLSGFNLEGLFRNPSFYQRVYEPLSAPDILSERAIEARRACERNFLPGTGRQRCIGNANIYDRLALEIFRSPAATECNPAARAVRPYFEREKAPPEKEADDFDDRCLASLLPWKHPDGSMHADPSPAVFDNGGERDGVRGALKAVALIEINEGAGFRPICGGLLLPRNRVVTARHCFSQEAVFADHLVSGRLHVRAVDAVRDAWVVPGNQVTLDDLKIQKPVADDWIVLNFNAPQEVKTPLISFRDVAAPEPAVVLGYFAHYDQSRQASYAGAVGGVSLTVPHWQQALRWTRDGLCHALSTQTRCLRVMCETVPGYSGSPIFIADSADPARPLTVLGLISRPDRGTDASCGTSDSSTTLGPSLPNNILN